MKIKNVKYTKENSSFLEKIVTNLEMAGVSEAIVREHDTERKLERIWLSILTLFRKLKIKEAQEVHINCKDFDIYKVEIKIMY